LSKIRPKFHLSEAAPKLRLGFFVNRATGVWILCWTVGTCSEAVSYLWFRFLWALDLRARHASVSIWEPTNLWVPSRRVELPSPFKVHYCTIYYRICA